ncbi:hypothetical protein JQ615_41205 [Bradyrhizobium jicamae]|uniref:Uncharacterized protein n=1 Tax=Bradyrhizobium jicamae TaxID=280332 RepID=A0ABS5FYG9_9BRAD|nr:hypothetical protein [Bradyrhizobium jicamae]MBR0801761.1 hypothetical protein [Bradyrhizobium jicamae]
MDDCHLIKFEKPRQQQPEVEGSRVFPVSEAVGPEKSRGDLMVFLSLSIHAINALIDHAIPFFVSQLVLSKQPAMQAIRQEEAGQ